MRVLTAAGFGFAAPFAFVLLLGSVVAHADDDGSGKQGPIPFAGGQLTITQKEEYGEKTLAYDGRELASNYVVYYTGTVKVGGADVALFDVGDGGNACGPAVVMVWKPEGGDIKSLSVGEDECGAPRPAVNEDAIYFVPWLMPGGSEPVKKWSPASGMTLAGNLTYMPDPGTGWKDVRESYDYVLDAFHNEAVYKAATQMLGDRLADVTTSLLVGSGTQKTGTGIVYASGCVPHACGGNDGFMAIDAKNKKLYFAREGDNSKIDTWPVLDSWPADLAEAMKKAFTPPQ
jgi:hypothetical protein